MTIGENIKRLRKAKKIPTDKIAKEIGCNRSYLAQIENDFKLPSVSILIQLAIILDGSIDDLVNLNELKEKRRS